MKNNKIEIKIREYAKSDKKRIEELFVNFEDFLASVDNLKRLNRKRTLIKLQYGKVYLNNVNKLISEHKGVFYVAESDNKIIGFVIGLVYKPSKIQKIEVKRSWIRGDIAELYIEKAYRKKGVGKILIKKVEEYLIKNKCEYINISVLAPNKSARMFYEKVGYYDRTLELIKEIK